MTKRIFTFLLCLSLVSALPTTAIAKTSTAVKVVAAYVAYKIITKDKKEEKADNKKAMQEQRITSECEEDSEDEECEEY